MPTERWELLPLRPPIGPTNVCASNRMVDIGLDRHQRVRSRTSLEQVVQLLPLRSGRKGKRYKRSSAKPYSSNYSTMPSPMIQSRKACRFWDSVQVFWLPTNGRLYTDLHLAGSLKRTPKIVQQSLRLSTLLGNRRKLHKHSLQGSHAQPATRHLSGKSQVRAMQLHLDCAQSL